MPVDCYKSSSSSSSSSSSYSSASEKNQPAKNPGERIPRGGSVNLRGIRDGIEGIGDAIDRLRRRVRGGKRTGEEPAKNIFVGSNFKAGICGLIFGFQTMKKKK